MCYSAEVWTLYDAYVRQFSANIDIKSFWNLYLAREEKYRTLQRQSAGPRIPKGLDLNFLRPRSELERKIQDLIGEWNGRKLAESEAELAKQEQRLAAAETKLTVRPTKTAQNEQRIAGNKVRQLRRWIEDAKRTRHEPARDDRIFPDWYAPCCWSSQARRSFARCATTAARRACRPQAM